MIVEINVGPSSTFYNVQDEIAANIDEYHSEFSKWLNGLEGNHPFRTYVELVEREGTVSYAGYANTFGGDDFIDWLNVDKCDKKVAEKLRKPPFPKPDVTIYF